MKPEIKWEAGVHAQVRHVLRDLGKLQVVEIQTCPHVHHSEQAASRCANQMMRKWKAELAATEDVA